MDIITGYTGTPHITAENDRDINIGIFGSKSYVLQTGTMLTAEISNNNEIKVRDGVIMHQGCAASIKKNTYDSVTINNGSQGMKRIDLLVARYEKQPETNVESLTLKVLQGTPVETSPQVPEHTEGDIQVGDTVADMPLYEVEIDGLNITEIRKVFQTMGDLESVNGNSYELHSDGYTHYKKYNNGMLEVWGLVSVSYTNGLGTIVFPDDYCFVDYSSYTLFVSPAYVDRDNTFEIMSTQKMSGKLANVYSRKYPGLSDKLPTHDCDFYAIGRWK